jgi:hypothetical protein
MNQQRRRRNWRQRSRRVTVAARVAAAAAAAPHRVAAPVIGPACGYCLIAGHDWEAGRSLSQQRERAAPVKTNGMRDVMLRLLPRSRFCCDGGRDVGSGGGAMMSRRDDDTTYTAAAAHQSALTARQGKANNRRADDSCASEGRATRGEVEW